MATHSVRTPGHGEHPRSPLGVSAPFLGLAVLALALAAAPDLPWQGAAAACSLFALAAAIRIVRQWRELRRLRTLADRIILRSPSRLPSSPLISWRAQELTSARHRHTLAAEVRRLTRELEPTSMPGAVPLNRPAARPYRDELEALGRLLGGTAPIGPRGVLLAQSLLSDPAGPLYDRAAAANLEPMLRRVLAVLGDGA